MRQIPPSPSLVPNAGGTVYIVLDDFGNSGAAYRETDPEDCDRAAVIRDLLQGQFRNPVSVIAFNTAEGWSDDVSEEIARAVLERARAEDEPLPRRVQAFCERHTSDDLQADLFAAWAHQSSWRNSLNKRDRTFNAAPRRSGEFG
jgi:hypothetical protein